MQTSPERIGLTHLSRLNVLIHPLYEKKATNETPDVAFFHSERERMGTNMLTRMTPKSSSEATLFVPLIANSQRDSTLKREIVEAKQNETNIQWTTLCKEMVKSQGHGRNIILGSNLVDNKIDGKIDPKVVYVDLNRKGFILDSNTKICVGGELLGACLLDGVDLLLKLPEITSLEVDKDCTLTSSYLSGVRRGREEESYERFKSWFQSKGMIVTENDGLITISKRKQEYI